MTAQQEREGYVMRYGHLWPPLVKGRMTPLQKVNRDLIIERSCCLREFGCAQSTELLPPAEHFRRFVSLLCSPTPDGIFYLEWNPWAVLMVDEFFANKFTAVCGCTHAGKSRVLSAISCGLFLLSPRNTKVLVTSTTVRSAEGKVWGDICDFWNQACQTVGGEQNLPGELMKSHPIIRFRDEDRESHKAGIELVPTQLSSEKQSVEKVQGYHNASVFFMGDEWDTLPPALIKTVRSNLLSNRNSRAMGVFNPTSRFSPGGEIAKPVGGYGTITEESTRWKTRDGTCIRFDAEKSPNIEAGYEKWKGIPTPKYLDEMREQYHGGKTAEYWTMVRGWFPPTGESDCIYSEAGMLLQYHADDPVTTWLDAPVKLAALDPSFTHGGDEAPMVIGQVGMARIGDEDRKVFERLKTIILDEEITDKSVDKSEQVVRLTKKHLLLNGVAPENFACDITGAASFGSLLSREIGSGWMKVLFSGKPTNLPISKSDPRKGADVFANLCSEMWYVGLPLMREGQIKGIDAKTAEEMCSRNYGTRSNNKVIVESKEDMYKRSQKSPNLADAMFICLHVARTKHGLSGVEKPARKAGHKDHPLSELDKFFRDNPHLNPPRRRTAGRVQHEALEDANAGSWG